MQASFLALICAGLDLTFACTALGMYLNQSFPWGKPSPFELLGFSEIAFISFLHSRCKHTLYLFSTIAIRDVDYLRLDKLSFTAPDRICCKKL